MAEIEATFPELSFIQIDRDAYPQVGLEWDIYGIPSFVVVDNGREIGRLVNKKRKHKEEIVSFLAGLE